MILEEVSENAANPLTACGYHHLIVWRRMKFVMHEFMHGKKRIQYLED